MDLLWPLRDGDDRMALIDEVNGIMAMSRRPLKMVLKHLLPSCGFYHEPLNLNLVSEAIEDGRSDASALGSSLFE